VAETITLKGEFQEVSRRLEGRFQRVLFARDQSTHRDWILVGYAASLVVALGVLTGGLAGEHAPVAPIWALLLLGGSALAAERQSVRLSARAEISVSFLPIVLAAVLYGPLAAIVVSAASLSTNFGRPYVRWVVWTASRSLAAGAAGMVAWTLGSGSTHSFSRVAGAVAAATVVEQLGDLALGSVTAFLRGMRLVDVAREASSIFVAIPLYTPIIALLIYAYRELSPWSVAFFLVPAFAAQRLFLLYKEQRGTAEDLALAVAKHQKAHLSFATALVATLDARDRYTAGHSAAVAAYASDIAARMGLSDEQQQLAHLCGLVHDIGKVGLSSGLLEKAGPLTLEERRQMEEHSEIGERILANIDDYAEIAAVVRHHHERVDGNGYPDGLMGSAIPLLSRIIMVADAYDAMTSDRPYRDAMPTRVARLRLAQAVESQFDTAVVAAFEAILAGASEEYRTGASFSFGRESEQHRDLMHTAAAI
jgi:putative nucleotidyltransferase with HDIG domain